MEQCVQRPPEKVLIMPSTSHSAPRSPTNNAKKPVRARASLLSIISAGTEPKSPTKSVSSDTDERVASPTTPTSPTTSSVQTVLSPTSESDSSPSSILLTEDKCSIAESQVEHTKKAGPPTLAKTFKAKPPPTAAKPLKYQISQSSDTEVVATKSGVSQIVIDTKPAEASSGIADHCSASEGTLTVEVAVNNVELSDPVGTLVVKSMKVDEHAVIPVVQSNISEPSATLSSDIIVETNSLSLESEITYALNSIMNTAVQDFNTKPAEFDIPPPVSVDSEFPPPIMEEELPPPPPDTEMELPPPGQTAAPIPSIPAAAESSDDVNNDMEFPPPPEMDFTDGIADISDNSQIIKEAVDKISSKYDTSLVAVNNNHCTKETQEGYSELSKHSLLTKDSVNESVDIPSHSSNHHNEIASISSETNNNMTDEVVTTLKPALKEVELTLETEQSVAESIEGRTLSISSPLSEFSETESHSDGAIMSATEDEDSITHLITPSNLPAASSFTASDSVISPNGVSSDNRHVNRMSPPNISVMGDRDTTLPPTQHTEESQTPSSSVSPAAHSPPFNTSSESGDSGIESGLYSLVGETVPVKLRPTTNDNRKPDKSVPMFDRNSSELKRVTFRESPNQITPGVVSRKTAAEEAQIKKTGLSENEISQAELFYKGHKTEVMVCPCLGTLYFTESSSGDSVAVQDWKAEHIGIPVLIYNTGEGKRARGLTLVFAEKGTGFLLWKTVINYESRWEVVEPVFHRLRIPGTADKLAGVAYQDEASAESFYNYFKLCTSDPEKNVLNNPNLKNKKKKEKKKSVKHPAISLPTKSAISKPCQFTHVTQLKQSEQGILALAMVPVDEESSEDGVVN